MASANTLRAALIKLFTEGKMKLPEVGTKRKGPGTAPYDSLTEEGAQGFADPRFSLDELIAKEASEEALGPTLSKTQKQELKRSGNKRIKTTVTPRGDVIPGVANKEEMAARAADKQKLYDATKGQQSYKTIEDPAGEKMTLDRILESEVDESLASKTNAAQVDTRPGTRSGLNLRLANEKKSQLDNLGRSSEEQDILDEAVRIRGAAEKSTNADVDQLGPTRLRKKIGVTAKNFGNKKELNTDIQDLYSRLDEMFPGFAKKTINSK